MNIRALILCIALLLPITSQAVTAIFYQPQTADQSISMEKWRTVFSSIHKKGIDTVVVQWTQYGDFLSTEQEIEWLKEVLFQAKSAKLKIIMGLNADPDVFSKTQQAPAGLEIYFQKSLESNKHLMSKWMTSALMDGVVGWYIPLEIDDREWRDAERRSILKRYLDRQSEQIRSSSPKPIYISSFFTGNMTPDSYSQLLQDLKSGNALKIWVQDGSGTNKLTASERSLYLNTISNCKTRVVDGVIFEIFTQTKHDQVFAAESLSPASLASKLKQRAPCKEDSLFFELRYLINLQPK
jgi:hypothetical protein